MEGKDQEKVETFDPEEKSNCKKSKKKEEKLLNFGFSDNKL